MSSTATAAPEQQTRKLSYIQAIAEAQLEELRRDPTVIAIGQDVTPNAYGTFGGFLEEFGPKRIRDVPISENSFTGAALGAAMAGLRPIVDMTIASFAFNAMEQIVNQGAKARYMFGGQVSVPATIRLAAFYANSTAAHHADRPHTALMTVPGLKIVFASSPREVKGLMKSSIRDDDTVLFFEAVPLWASREEVPDDDEFLIPLGRSHVKREGSDVTVAAVGPMVPLALKAAEAAAADGVSVEVVDLRTLVPLDWAGILGSAAKTKRLVAVDLAPHTCSVASEIVATAAEELFSDLEAAPVRVAAPDMQVPFSPAMERGFYPEADDIAAAIRKVTA